MKMGLKVYQDDLDYTVWLDAANGSMCIGRGESKREALDNALSRLTELLAECADMRLALGPPKPQTDPIPLTDAEYEALND